MSCVCARWENAGGSGWPCGAPMGSEHWKETSGVGWRFDWEPCVHTGWQNLGMVFRSPDCVTISKYGSFGAVTDDSLLLPRGNHCMKVVDPAAQLLFTQGDDKC